ncbi:MAG: aldehyde dehydrogenase EutE [Oscillospiraceae bacterium]|jgi:propionaldehyde dehydrogenase|nr:aldehyde dehydrogenase EutE [Oscillospiraceae bacterium]
MALTEQQIHEITEEIVRELMRSGTIGAREDASAGRGSPGDPQPVAPHWLCEGVDEAVSSAKHAQQALADMTLARRGEIIAAMRVAAVEHAARLAELAHQETGYGHVEDKIKKNLLVAKGTPGIEDLITEAHTGDRGMTLVERAPFGVVGSVTPSTNPTATVINNAISMVAAGNAVVFNPHPAAKRASQEAMRVLNEAVEAAGGPPSLVTTVREPTQETGLALMAHRDIPLLSITGGEAVVRLAMGSGKRVIAAGPGNPPVIVDDTADMAEAAQRIVDGASFDNNVLCVAEKEVFAFASITEKLMEEMALHGALRIAGGDIDKVVRTVLVEKNGQYSPNRAYVGRDAAVILRDSGVAFSGNPRLVIAQVDRDHPFIHTEMLMPVLGIVRVRDIDEAVDEAVRAEQGNRHSAMIHSANVHHMSKAARRLNTTIFVKNASSYAGLGFGGEGHPTMTIATPTGEGITSARTFTRYRRCVLYGDFRIC